MAELLRMPEVAANAESALLSSWAMPEGSSYSAHDVIAVIETDKAIVDFEAEVAGTLLRQLVSDGTEVPVGAPIALIASEGEKVDDVDSVLVSLGALQSTTSMPYGHAEIDTTDDATSSKAPLPVDAAAFQGQTARRDRFFSSPLARKLAREAGLDLTSIEGTGRDGTIVRRDVLAAIDAASVPAPITKQPAPSTPPVPDAGFVDIPHTRLRKAIAHRLTESKSTAPHFYLRGTANVDELLRLREQINSGPQRVSINDLLIKAIARTHKAVPAMNVIWRDDAIRHFQQVDISVAVSTPNGLVTPVVRGAEHLSVTQIAVMVKDFAERARGNRIQQHELEGGSISISNLGMYGTEEFAAIINPPQAAILAVGATRRAPVVRDGSLEIGNVLTATLSVDHRAVDGVVAAEWMANFIAFLEAPARILA